MTSQSHHELDRIVEIAEDLAQLARRLRGEPAPGVHYGLPIQASLKSLSPRLPHFAALARAEYAARRNRASFIDNDLLGEPGWDILLDLFIHQVAGRRVAVTSACIASAVPSTTALRWITILEEKKLVEREADVFDGRRSYLRLSDQGMAQMVRHFEQCDRQQSAHEMSAFTIELINRGGAS